MFARSVVGDVHDVRRSFDQFLSSVTGEDRTSSAGDVVFTPPVETSWTPDAYHLRFIIPGVPERRVRTTVQGNQLLVQGERSVPEAFATDGCAHLHLSYGRFAKHIDLPGGLNVDKLTAQLRDGILNVTIPVHKQTVPRPIRLEAVLPEAWELAEATV